MAVELFPFAVRGLMGGGTRMDDLMAIANQSGLMIISRDMGGTMGRYWHRRGLIALSPRLSLAQRRSTLAHELGHAFYADDALAAPVTDSMEARADEWAARTLISANDYARAERIIGSAHPGALAHELGVTARIVAARQRTLQREFAQY